MRKTIDSCVDCPSMGLPCQGSACSFSSQEVEFCDRCETEIAEYVIDRECFCESCARKVLDKHWNTLSLSDKIDLLTSALDIELI